MPGQRLRMHLTIPLHDIATDATSTPQAKQLWARKLSACFYGTWLGLNVMFTWNMAELKRDVYMAHGWD